MNTVWCGDRWKGIRLQAPWRWGSKGEERKGGGGGATTEKPIMQVFSCNSSSRGDFFLINKDDIVPPTEPTAVRIWRWASANVYEWMNTVIYILNERKINAKEKEKHTATKPLKKGWYCTPRGAKPINQKPLLKNRAGRRALANGERWLNVWM